AESYYRAQTLNRLDSYAKLKTEYVKYIKQRDEAALQGKEGSVGLTVFYTFDMVGNAMAAAGIPMAKFYTAVRSVGDKSVAAYEALRPYFSRPEPTKAAGPSSSSGAPGTAAPSANIPDMGFRVAHGLATAPARPDAGMAAVPTASATPSRLATSTAEENTRAVIRTLEAARELHKAVAEAIELDRSHPGVDRLREWTKPQQEPEKPKAFSVSKGAGQVADTTFK